MRFYVAGRTTDIATVREAQAVITEDAHMITYDWTLAVEENERKETNKIGEKIYAARCAAADIRGVRTADVVILLVRSGAKGTFVELGAALALGIPVWVFVLEEFGRCVFLEHPGVRRFNVPADKLAEALRQALPHFSGEHSKRMPYADRLREHNPNEDLA